MHKIVCVAFHLYIKNKMIETICLAICHRIEIKLTRPERGNIRGGAGGGGSKSLQGLAKHDTDKKRASI